MARATFSEVEHPTPEPGSVNIPLQIRNLQEQMGRDAKICKNLESNWIPQLEKELAELEADAPVPPAKVACNESTGILTTSLVLEELTPIGPARHDAVAGSIITTLEGAALAELREKNPRRKVIRVSLETLKSRKAAGHVCE